MSRYTITEPHPTVTQNTYVHAGRGGAGNHFRAPLTTSPAGVPTPITPTASNTSSSSFASTASTRRFYSGRGGAGNAHSHIDRPTLSFEDEFSRAAKRDRTTALGVGYHVGRGGAGNFALGAGAGVGVGVGPRPVEGDRPGKNRSNSSSSSASARSSSSVGSGILKRLSGVFKN